MTLLSQARLSSHHQKHIAGVKKQSKCRICEKKNTRITRNRPKPKALICSWDCFATEFSQRAQQHPGGQQRDSGIRGKTSLQGKKPELQGETVPCVKTLQPQACSEWRRGDELRRTMHPALKPVRFSSLNSVGTALSLLPEAACVGRAVCGHLAGEGDEKNISEFRARLPCQHLSDSRLHLPPDLSKSVTTLNTERSHRDRKIKRH